MHGTLCRQGTPTSHTLLHAGACRTLNSSNDRSNGLDIVHEEGSKVADETGELHS
jgi:hypothetical protein